MAWEDFICGNSGNLLFWHKIDQIMSAEKLGVLTEEKNALFLKRMEYFLRGLIIHNQFY